MSQSLARWEEARPEILVEEEFTVETIEEALAACAEAYAENELKRAATIKRWEELKVGKQRLRRRQARNEVNAFILPVNLFSIEEAD
jgi:hypothetical protein